MDKKKVILYLCKRGICPNCSPECHLTSNPERAIYDYPDEDPETSECFYRDETPNYIYFIEKEEEK